MKPKILFIALITTIIFLFHFLSGCKKNENADEIVPLACKIIKPEQNEIITKGDTVLVLINFSGTEGPNNAKNLFIDVHSRQLSNNKPYHYSWNTFYEDTGIHNLYIEYYDPENVEGGAVDYCKVSIVKGNFPYADFDADNISGIAPLLVSFTDKSDNSPTFWHWEFGDGSTSTLQNPTHIYTETGSYIVSLTAGNLNGKSTREEFNYINVIEFNPCPGTPTISYQGQVYNTVQIGDQCWMRENLNWDTASSSCYNNSPTNCEVYGRLYNWHTIMNGAQASNSVPSGVQGICMEGWHVPSNAEWEILREALGGRTVAGGKMKEAGNNYWEEPNEGATNESGFTALPAGLGGSWFLWLGMLTGFWSTTQPNINGHYYWQLSSNHPAFTKESNFTSAKYSLRCVKD